MIYKFGSIYKLEVLEAFPSGKVIGRTPDMWLSTGQAADENAEISHVSTAWCFPPLL